MNRWNSLSYTVQVSNDCGYHKYEEVEDTQYKLDVGIRYHNLLHIKAVWLQPGKKRNILEFILKGWVRHIAQTHSHSDIIMNYQKTLSWVRVSMVDVTILVDYFRCIVLFKLWMDVVAFKHISTMTQHPIIIDKGNPPEPKSQFLTTFTMVAGWTNPCSFFLLQICIFLQRPKEVSRNCM